MGLAAGFAHGGAQAVAQLHLQMISVTLDRSVNARHKLPLWKSNPDEVIIHGIYISKAGGAEGREAEISTHIRSLGQGVSTTAPTTFSFGSRHHGQETRVTACAASKSPGTKHGTGSAEFMLEGISSITAKHVSSSPAPHSHLSPLV